MYDALIPLNQIATGLRATLRHKITKRTINSLEILKRQSIASKNQRFSIGCAF